MRSKPHLKMIVSGMMALAALPIYLLYCLHRMLFGKRRAFTAVMQTVSLWPGISGEWIRRAMLKWITGQPLIDCVIGFGTTFSDPRLVIGDRVYIGPRCDIGWADIGSDCLLGSGVHLLSGQAQHFSDDIDIPIREQGGAFTRITIGQDCWIGNGAIVSADIGIGCIIGAGSVVARPIDDYRVATGNPVKEVLARDR